MSAHKFNKQIIYNPTQLGVNGHLFASSFNSTAFGCGGFNQLTIDYVITRAAATDISFFLGASADGGTTYGLLRVGDLDPSTGIETMRQRQFVAADVATQASGQINIPINIAGNAKIMTIIGTAATTDTVKMWVTLGNV